MKVKKSKVHIFCTKELPVREGSTIETMCEVTIDHAQYHCEQEGDLRNINFDLISNCTKCKKKLKGLDMSSYKYVYGVTPSEIVI